LEWCADNYDPGYYQVSPIENPYAIEKKEPKEKRVCRGGYWRSSVSELLCFRRFSLLPNEQKDYIGVRLAVSKK
jgi:formylglycine-generating enzyme required for sulfatase activity